MTNHFNAETRRAQRFAERGRSRVLGSAFLGALCVSALSLPRRRAALAGAPNLAPHRTRPMQRTSVLWQCGQVSGSEARRGASLGAKRKREVARAARA
jgi:hypothetical protein